MSVPARARDAVTGSGGIVDTVADQHGDTAPSGVRR